MSEENWVKLPEPRPRTLPQDALLKLCSWCKDPLVWAVTSELVAEDDAGLIRYRGRAAADGRPDIDFVVAEGNISRVRLPPGYRFEGSKVVRDKACSVCFGPAPCSCAELPLHQQRAIRENRLYVQRCEALRKPQFGAPPRSGKSALLREYQAQVDGLKEQFTNSMFSQVQHQGIESPIAREVREQTQLLLGDCPNCARVSWNPVREKCDHCGVTSKELATRPIFKTTCACGSTENVRHEQIQYGGVRPVYGPPICAACYLERRKAEVRKDLDRPAQAKRDPYEWLGFSSSSWEE